MGNIFPGSNSNKVPVSLGAIVDFINENTNQNIVKNNVGLRNIFDIMRQESFQAENGNDFFTPDKFSEMFGMLGYENQPPTITLQGDAEVSILRGKYP